MIRRRILFMDGVENMEGIKWLIKGETTIEQDASDIIVQSNKNEAPDYACLRVKGTLIGDIQNSSCIYVIYNIINYTDTGNQSYTPPFYDEVYMHKSSNGTFSTGSSFYGLDTGYNAANDRIKFRRGVSDWRAVDSNSQPIVYEWWAIKFDNN